MSELVYLPAEIADTAIDFDPNPKGETLADRVAFSDERPFADLFGALEVMGEESEDIPPGRRLAVFECRLLTPEELQQPTGDGTEFGCRWSDTEDWIRTQPAESRAAALDLVDALRIVQRHGGRIPDAYLVSRDTNDGRPVGAWQVNPTPAELATEQQRARALQRARAQEDTPGQATP